MRVDKGRNKQPLAILKGFTQSGQAMEGPGLTVARVVVTLVILYVEEGNRYTCKTMFKFDF